MGKGHFFGAGRLYGLDNSSAVPTPQKFGTLQEVNIEFNFGVKELHGAKQFPVDVARGKGKITGKAKSAKLQGALLGALFFSETAVTGEIKSVENEAGTIPDTPGPYTITVANAADFRKNLGVVFAVTGVPLSRVVSGPATGQYSVDESTGIYTFAAADKLLGVLIDYLYDAASSGKTITMLNREMAQAPSFMGIFTGVFDGVYITLILNKCISNKLTMPFKNEDFVVSEFDFEASTDDADQLGLLSLGK